MLKKFSFILFIILSFVLISGQSGYSESLTLKQESNLINYIKESIDDYVQTVNWTEARIYQKEANEIGKIIEKFGYKYEEYGVTIFNDQKTKRPTGIFVILVSKVQAGIEYRILWKATPIRKKQKSNLDI